MSRLQEERLQLTSHGNNHNKFYNMRELSSKELADLPPKLLHKVKDKSLPYFLATWGRVGNAGQSAPFSMLKWDDKLHAKTRKGYVRLTSLLSVEDGVPSPEKEPSVNKFLAHLQKASRTSVASNYAISKFGDVTQTQLDKVQHLLDAFGDMIADQATMYALTQQLGMIWTILPRKIEGDLRSLKITSYEEARKQLEIENDLVDALAAQCTVAASGGKRISEAMQMTFEPRDDMLNQVFPDYPYICDHNGDRQGTVDAMWTAIHHPTTEAYNAFYSRDDHPKEFLYFHGSVNKNWLSIFDGGLKIRPAGVSTNGDMFGRGLYFAADPMKSLGYCGLEGIDRWADGNEECVYLALFRVNVGIPLVLKDRGDERKVNVITGGGGTLSTRKLSPFGFGSVLVKAGYHTSTGRKIYNEEIIVFKAARTALAALARVRVI